MLLFCIRVAVAVESLEYRRLTAALCILKTSRELISLPEHHSLLARVGRDKLLPEKLAFPLGLRC